MIICNNCGKQLSELTAGLHYCSDNGHSTTHFCDVCGKELLTWREQELGKCLICHPLEDEI